MSRQAHTVAKILKSQSYSSTRCKRGRNGYSNMHVQDSSAEIDFLRSSRHQSNNIDCRHVSLNSMLSRPMAERIPSAFPRPYILPAYCAWSTVLDRQAYSRRHHPRCSACPIGPAELTDLAIQTIKTLPSRVINVLQIEHLR